MLETLFNQGHIWQARRTPSVIKQGLCTGFEPFNHLLKNHGWPAAGIIDILYPTEGIGEVSLLLPQLAHCSQQEHWQIWVNPPHKVNGHALLRAGIDLRYIALVHTNNSTEILWATEEAIKNTAVYSVVSWPTALNSAQVRRLHLCATQYDTPCFLLRKPDHVHTTCALKINLQPVGADQLHIHILKQQQGVCGQSITLHLPRSPQWRYPVQL